MEGRKEAGCAGKMARNYILYIIACIVDNAPTCSTTRLS